MRLSKWLLLAVLFCLPGGHLQGRNVVSKTEKPKIAPPKVTGGRLKLIAHIKNDPKLRDKKPWLDSHGCGFFPQGDYYMSGDGSVWSTKTWKPVISLNDHRSNVGDFGITQDGAVLLMDDDRDDMIKVLFDPKKTIPTQQHLIKPKLFGDFIPRNFAYWIKNVPSTAPRAFYDYNRIEIMETLSQKKIATIKFTNIGDTWYSPSLTEGDRSFGSPCQLSPDGCLFYAILYDQSYKKRDIKSLGALHAWAIPSGQHLFSLPSRIQDSPMSFQLSSDSRYLLDWSKKKNHIQLLNAKTGKTIAHIQHAYLKNIWDKKRCGADFTADSKHLVVLTKFSKATQKTTQICEYKTYEIETGKFVGKFVIRTARESIMRFLFPGASSELSQPVCQPKKNSPIAITGDLSLQSARNGTLSRINLKYTAAHTWLAEKTYGSVYIRSHPYNKKKNLSSFSVIETVTDQEITKITLPGEASGFCCFSPKGSQLLVGEGLDKGNSQWSSKAYSVWDLTCGARSQKEMTAKGFPKLWEQLASKDLITGRRAVWELSRGGTAATKFLEKKFAAKNSLTVQQINQLIKQLDSKSYRTRQQATAQLQKAGAQVILELKKTLKSSPSAECLLRIKSLLKSFETALRQPARTATTRRALRVREVLARINTPAAKKLLRQQVGL